MSMDAEEKNQSVKYMHKQIDLHPASQHLHKKACNLCAGREQLDDTGNLLTMESNQSVSPSFNEGSCLKLMKEEKD